MTKIQKALSQIASDCISDFRDCDEFDRSMEACEIAEGAQELAAVYYRTGAFENYASEGCSVAEIEEAACGIYRDDPFDPIYEIALEQLNAD